MFDLIKRDFARYLALDFDKPSLANRVRVALSPQFQLTANYRFGRWVRARIPNRVARLPFVAANVVAEKAIHTIWGMFISGNADIGGGLYIGHPGMLLVGECKIGEDCNLTANTFIGKRTDGAHGEAVPTIGNRVWIGTGAVVFGAISIGDGTSIGPLTVVGRNLGPRSLAIGNPMKVIGTNHDNTRQIYGAAGAPSGPSRGGCPVDIQEQSSVPK
jgi:serine O-acetyltransferase